jgi:beta-aspartyl-peptidase (threonine type)
MSKTKTAITHDRAAKTAMAVFGGCGEIDLSDQQVDADGDCRRALADSLLAGHHILARGGSALDAVQAAICVLENFEGFNAGRGSVLTRSGTVEMDAAIMDGKNRRAGSVACVTRIKNPVLAARAVMERSSHVMLIGPGAEKFAADNHLELVDNAYFITDLRRKQLEAFQRKLIADGKKGTVGAVARDNEGHLAAATSTGGTINKHPGRVGDTPIIGGGTWADDEGAAVSSTGEGEAFVRSGFAHEVDALIRIGKLELAAACDQALQRVAQVNGNGGCIAITRTGPPVIRFICRDMFRAFLEEGGVPETAIYGHETLQSLDAT